MTLVNGLESLKLGSCHHFYCMLSNKKVICFVFNTQINAFPKKHSTHSLYITKFLLWTSIHFSPNRQPVINKHMNSRSKKCRFFLPCWCGRANRFVFVLGSCGNKSTVTYCVCVICSSGAFDTFVLISVANANHLFDKLTLHATILNGIYD